MTPREALLEIAHLGWHKAIKAELTSLTENHTWDLMELPPNRRVLSARWVLRTKSNLSPTHICLKARRIAKGFEQKPGLDYNNKIAPMVKWSTLRTIIALAIAMNWKPHHLDIITTFLNGLLQECIYMHQPPAFKVPGFEHLVCKLNRSLYGLKEIPRLWYREIDRHLHDSS